MKELPKAFNPTDHEQRLYSMWEHSGAFSPNLKSKISNLKFSIIMPPPNANGELHVGHVLNTTIQDILVRYHRMRGDCTLFLPGADHAGFETQIVYERKLDKEGKSRFDFSRDELYRQIEDFTAAKKNTMRNQFKRIGISADWGRERYTLDPAIVKLVLATYEQLKKDGLIYRGEKLVNWCIKHQTTLSDLEVTREERTDSLYYITYGPLAVATTRPETLFGDVAVAVHPEDRRYKKLIGTKVPLPLTNRKVMIIADGTVDPAFGTGAVKITPNHDFNDFEIAGRHKLKGITVIGFDGRLNDQVPKEFAGLKVKAARDAVTDALKKTGVLEKIDESYQHSVATCYKCPTVIEPLLRESWYLAMDKAPKSGGASLKQRGLEALDETTILPERYIGVYRHWLANIKDWPLSRQIVWGIPIPDSPDETFDTWFSSGQWPVVTLKSTGNFDMFYPTDVMVTAYEILFFWVARMLMLGHYMTGKYPFRTVYLHGLVRDKDRQKMSKSKGNVLDPLGVIDDYGTDALRMALIFGVGIGTDIAISTEKIRGMRNFANKIWNVARFVLQNGNSQFSILNSQTNPKSQKDQELSDEVNKLVKQMSAQIEQFQFHQAAETIYSFTWHRFADYYLEESKKGTVSLPILHSSFFILLKLLHPFMPFVTEAIWQELYERKLVNEPLLITAPWPVV